MNKKLLLTAFVLMLVSGVSGQSLQGFEYSPGNGFERSLTGGESFSQTVNFSSVAGQEVPFGVRVTVENDSTDFVTDNVGAEFDLTGSLKGPDTVRGLDFEERLSDGNLVYVGSVEDDGLSAGSDYSVELVVEADPRIRPDSFGFEFDVRSVAGFASESETEVVDFSENSSVEVEAGDSEVEVSADEDSEVNVTVESYDEVTVSPPDEDSSFVGGVGVDVEKGGEEVEASGTVSIGYDQSYVDENGLNESSMDVYFYDEASGEWTTEGVDVVSRDLQENVVEADVEHFSTYALFAEVREDEVVPSFTGPIEWSPPRGEEDVNDSTQPDQNGTDEQEDTDSGEDQDQSQDESSEGEDPGQQETGPQQSQPGSGPTGFFTAQTGNVALGLAVLFVAVVGVLQYLGRVDVRKASEVLRNWGS